MNHKYVYWVTWVTWVEPNNPITQATQVPFSCGLDGQFNGHRRPLPFLAFNIDLSVVALNKDALADGQPKPRSPQLGSKEGVEDLFQVLFSNSAALVRKRDHDG
jgi:hypothetical protein